MKEYRCGKCKKLLGRLIGNRYEFNDDFNTNGLNEKLEPSCLEIKCSKCGKLNRFGVKEVLVGVIDN